MQSDSVLLLNKQRSKGLTKRQILCLVVGVGFLFASIVFTALVYQPQQKQQTPFMPLVGCVLSDKFGNWEVTSDITKGTGYYFKLLSENIQQVKLKYTLPGEYYLKPKSTYIEKVNADVIRESTSEMTFKMYDAESELFSIPNKFPFPYTKDSYSNNNEEDLYGYELLEGQKILRVYRKSGEKQITIFDTDTSKLLFSKLYTEIFTKLESQHLWGLGERRTKNYLLESGDYTVWNFDQSNIDKGTPHGQVYGTHPMWLQRASDGNYHIIMVKTANPMQIAYKQGESLTFKIVGGIVEIKFFFGGSDPRDVIKKYHRYVNGWTLHPFWASGWHQSRWGYKSSKELSSIVTNYNTNKIPIDIIWTDLDYMDKRKDFTLDETNFVPAELRQLFDKTQPLGVDYVHIVDPGVASISECSTLGQTNDIFIKSTKDFGKVTNGLLKGCVWPGDVYYPDFNHPKSTDVWHSCFKLFVDKYQINPSGIWIDMNENSNFVDSEIDPDVTCIDGWNPPTTTKSKSEVEVSDLPFNPQGDITLESHTVSISAIHYNKDDSNYIQLKSGSLTELNMHSLNGHMEGIATKESQKRFHNTNLTFILSRSTFAGSGRFVQHWLGDNASTWDWLSSSINAIFNLNMYGIPMVGDDICGFNDDTTPQLCSRWFQLGALYPFARSHNSIGKIPQEPWAFEPEYPYVLTSARTSINLRYQLLKFYYTLFVSKYDNELEAGVGTVFNPLFYIYNDDIDALTIDKQFFLGEDLVVSPAVEEQKDTKLTDTTFNMYVPKGATWFDLWSGVSLVGPQTKQITVGFEEIGQVSINAGRVVPLSTLTEDIQRVRNLPQNLVLAIALSYEDDGAGTIKYTAKGQYLSLANFDEQNVEARCWTKNASCHRDLIVTGRQSGNILTLSITNIQGTSYDNSEKITIERLQIYGVRQGGDFVNKIIEKDVQFSSLATTWVVQVQI